MRFALTRNSMTSLFTKLLTMPRAMRKAMFTLTGWKTSGVCSSVAPRSLSAAVAQLGLVRSYERVFDILRVPSNSDHWQNDVSISHTCRRELAGRCCSPDHSVFTAGFHGRLVGP